ncbi:hypothetical protein [Amycolatopsis sp. NPDC059021]|uniref:hypothetical protein n=1 Tax=Amycolatopsis sp. NPDC059021 TaxID=3346704 RepID=UPI003672F5C5
MWAPMTFALCVGCAGNLARGQVAMAVFFGAVALVLLAGVRMHAVRRRRHR